MVFEGVVEWVELGLSLRRRLDSFGRDPVLLVSRG